jgi:amino-acid N-acetyltransferase
MSDYILRRARVTDVVGMQRLINQFAERDAMLHRALHELYENIRDFHIILEGDEVVGTAALHVDWANLAEVKAVAVAEHCQRKGYGRLLIAACIEDARELGISSVYCLTYRPDFFGSIGFTEVDRANLPRKVWNECIRCPKFTNCTEIAMTCQVLDIPTVAPADPLTTLSNLPKRGRK